MDLNGLMVSFSNDAGSAAKEPLHLDNTVLLAMVRVARIDFILADYFKHSLLLQYNLHHYTSTTTTKIPTNITKSSQ